MTDIKYRINSVTSEHPRHPAGGLTADSPAGWQSAHNSAYPQAVTIQFYVPIRTKKMTLLFHQYKIPQLVEVFVKLGSNEKYRKLGFITPSPNQQSNFEEKEEKTLYFEFACTHLRLVLHQNYQNQRNIFNQVGLDDVRVTGELLNSSELQGVDLGQSSEEEEEEEVLNPSGGAQQAQVSHHVAAAVTTAAHSKEVSPLFREIYSKLEWEKKDAIGKEDYQRASNLKSILANFKQLEDELIQLQAEKQDALSREDYDRCHRIKQLIQNKKEVVEYQRQALMTNESNFYSLNSYSRVNTEVDGMGAKEEHTRKKITPMEDLSSFRSPEMDRRPQQAAPHIQHSNLHDEQVVPALLHKGKGLPLETNQKSAKEAPSFAVNQSSIPELINEGGEVTSRKDVSDYREPTERAEQSAARNQSFRMELQPLDAKTRLRLENYFDFIPQEVWQWIEAKSWRGKQEAVRYLSERIPHITNKEEYLAGLQLISRVIVSKQAALSIEILQTLQSMTELHLPFTLQHLPFFVEQIMLSLLNFLNDTNQKIKELSYRAYQSLPEVSFLKMGIVTKQLIKHKSGVKNDPKLVITKLSLMQSIIDRYREAQFPSKQVLVWGLQYCENQDQKVRAAAVELLTTLANAEGPEKIMTMVENSKPEYLKVLLHVMNSSLDQSKIQQSKLSLEQSKLREDFFGSDVGKKPPQQSTAKTKKSKKAKEDEEERPIYVLETKEGEGSQSQIRNRNSSRKDLENPVNLSYSKESSMMENSMNPRGEEESWDGEAGVCDYCHEPYKEGQDDRDHLINDCKVLVSCEKCGGLIYIREVTDHLLNECEWHHMFRKCRKCGIAFELTEINEHIAQGSCRKGFGVNWERCQFCGTDVMGEDKFWVEHAAVCRNLPTRRPYAEDESVDEDNQPYRE